MDARSRYLVGIDLGTTNCAVAYVDTHGRERPSADIRNFEVPQLVAPGETAPRAMLPSFLYLPGEHELPPGAARLPWNEGADRIVGEFARFQGAKVPSRLVSSAKSWLCHAGIDREADILPWGSPPEVKKVSPVEASAAYLRHIRDAWNHAFARTTRRIRLEHQEVVLTVPASFDEAARELTLEAAKRAELATITLLEEPQAAFYCWIVSHQDRWQREVRAGELILVCDIGGGTTDFSLITVVETPTGPGLPPRRRRRSPDARRRQHRPGAGASRREEARRTRGSTPSSGVRCGSPAGRPRRSCWASSSRRSSAGRSRSPGGARS